MQSIQPFDRLDSETPEAFGAFVAYRDAGAKRSFRQAAEDSGNDDKTCERWRTTHNWKDRALAWDRFIDRKSQEAQVDQIQKMKRRHVALAVRMQQLSMEGMQSITGDMLHVSDMARFAGLGVQLERDARGDTEISPVLGIIATDVEDVPKLVEALRASVEVHIEDAEEGNVE